MERFPFVWIKWKPRFPQNVSPDNILEETIEAKNLYDTFFQEDLKKEKEENIED